MKKLKSSHNHKVVPPHSDDSEEEIHIRVTFEVKAADPMKLKMLRLQVLSVTGVDNALILPTNVKLLLVSVAKMVISVEFVDSL